MKLVLVVALLMIPILLSSEDNKDKLLKARIIQLEQQLSDVVSSNTVCQAQLILLSQSKSKEQQQQQRINMEKELGCSIDWNAQPPICKE